MSSNGPLASHSLPDSEKKLDLFVFDRLMKPHTQDRNFRSELARKSVGFSCVKTLIRRITPDEVSLSRRQFLLMLANRELMATK